MSIFFAIIFNFAFVCTFIYTIDFTFAIVYTIDFAFAHSLHSKSRGAPGRYGRYNQCLPTQVPCFGPYFSSGRWWSANS